MEATTTQAGTNWSYNPWDTEVICQKGDVLLPVLVLPFAQIFGVSQNVKLRYK